MIFQARKYGGEGAGGAIVDRNITVEQRIGAKWVRITWLQDAYKPEVQWRLEQNGSPAPSMDIDVRAGSRRVRVSWPAGMYDAKWQSWDYEANEHSQPVGTNTQYRDGDSGWDIPASREPW